MNLLSHLKNISKLKLYTGALFILLFSAYGYTSALVSPYQPGSTLDPSCSIGDTNCFVQIIPSQTTHNGKFLTTDGSVTSWSVIPNTSLQNSSISINGTPVSLGGSVINLALTTNPLSQFSSTTSSQLAGVISDETGTGTLVYSTSPVFSGTLAIGTTATASPLTVGGDIRIATGSGGQIIFADGSTMSSAGLGSSAAVSNTTDAIVTADSDANTTGAILLKTGSNTRLSISNTGTIAIPTLSTGIVHSDLSGNLSSSLIVNTDITDGTIASTKLATLTSAQLATLLSDESGTGTIAYTTSPVFTTPNIGNATGNISGNAATVTTNANLTGPITSVGNATSVASQTGTGSVFVMQASPTLTTPNIGAATGTSLNLTSGTITSGLINGQTISSAANFTGTVSAAGSIYTSGTPGGHAASRGSIGYDSVGSNTQLWSWGPNASTQGGFTFNTRSSDGTVGGTPMVITAGGNVGIGATVPSGRLEITGGTTHTLYVDAPTDIGTHYGLEVRGAQNAYTAYFLGNGTAGQSAGLNIQAGTNASDGPLDVFNFAGTSLFRVRGDGNVGIGTTNPTSVNGSTKILELTNNYNVGLILNDTRAASAFEIFNAGAVLNVNYGATNRLSIDGATGATTFANRVSANTGLNAVGFALQETGTDRLTIGQSAAYAGNYIDSTNINLILKTVLVGGTGGTFKVQTGVATVSDALIIDSTHAATFTSSVQATSFYKNYSTPGNLGVPTYENILTYGASGSAYGAIQFSNEYTSNLATGFKLRLTTQANTTYDALTITSAGVATFSGDVIFNQKIYGSDGTAANPSIRFYNSPAGLYYPGADGLGIGVNGAEVQRFRSDGNTIFGSYEAQTSYYAAGGYKHLIAGGFELMYRNASDSYIHSNSQYNSGGSRIAKYTSPEGAGELALNGGGLNWLTYDGAVTGGVGYTFTSKFAVSKEGVTSVKGYSYTLGARPGAGVLVLGDINNSYAGIIEYDDGGQTTLHLDNKYDNATSKIEFRLRTSASPVTALSLSGTGAATFAGSISLTSSSAIPTVGIANNADGLLIMSGATNGVRINNAANTTQLFKITDAGVVSITGLVSCGGIQTNAGGAMSCTSDETLKDKHGSFTKGLDAIRSINPESFSWRQDSGLYDNGVIYYGFIAQNVQQALPEAISLSSTGKLQVSQLTLMAATINAVKELDIKVADLSSLDISKATSLGSLVKQFLADAGNSISLIITNTLETKNLCVADDSGAKTCLTKIQLDNLIANTHSTTTSSSSTTTTSTTPTDTTPPIITLTGPSSITISVGTTYTDEGATATDNIDTTVGVATIGIVDTGTAGTYTLTYTATDIAGNNAIPVTRTVIVESPVPVATP